MLWIHEVHQVDGRQADAFEGAFRDGFLPAVATSDDARLLYYLNHAVGTGPSYQVVTVTAVRDGRAWDRLAERIASGDLRDWANAVDSLRHDVRAKALAALPWSPLQEIDLAGVPQDAAEHPLSLFMEDTVWPYEGGLERYIEAAGSHYAEEMRQRESEGRNLLRIEASFRTRWGSHQRREVVLWQRVTEPDMLLGLLRHEVPKRYRQPGTWMHDALAWRDQWQSKLLRSAAWSPWH